ncbi:MAG: carbohydrate ABC transporter substrate-binding protein [Micrococcales bacterium]|uniref:ABC transporter substrate-binding protein n=1 Tax=Phycicoccus sp. TaxID=1902410 RepID=UPI0019B94DC0|nr:ABC transporter substrate-binding protein [Phycicoccus sp.]MBD3782178.1 carbohydrate ABC transporter substrate-binding protein [Micrococcales bacterium]HMM95128.1 ABC transporter substrate-binding protein [Phycicoccus sp.]
MALNSKRKVVAFAGIAAMSLVTAACSSGSSNDNTGGDTGKADTTDYSKWCDMKSELTGKSVSIYTSIVTPEDASHKASYKAFEDCTGVKINYEGDKDFEKNLPQRAQSGNLPDIAFIPQPGLLQTMVDTGKAIPASETVGKEVDQYFGADWRKYGSVDGTLYAAPLGANVKSYVWYSPKTFAAKGYTVPKTWDELMTLTAKIAADDPNAKPWCAGFNSGVATGWPGTDWVEDVLLRTAGPDVYDQWVAHKIPFNDPKVADALAKVGAILKDPKYTNGGFGAPSTIATTTFQDGGQPILKNKCYMHRQASFYASNWPEGTKVAEDGDVWAFYLPSVDDTSKPVLGGGEFVATFRDAPEVKAFAAFLASPDWANAKAKATTGGGWVSANKGLDPKNLVSPIDQQSAEILQDPKAVFRFDGSDMMPSAVGAGTFWSEMTNWIKGQDDKTTLDNIEKSWPTS